MRVTKLLDVRTIFLNIFQGTTYENRQKLRLSKEWNKAFYG